MVWHWAINAFLKVLMKIFVHLVLSNQHNKAWALIIGYNSADSALLVKARFPAKQAFLLDLITRLTC